MTLAERSQLALEMPFDASRAVEDFIVGHPNEAPFAFLEAWPDWPSHGAVLVGPAGCGKSHLASAWAARTGGIVIPAASLGQRDLLAGGGQAPPAWVIEDADRSALDETALFHVLNHCKEHRSSILVTGRSAPGAWAITLPDLRSRLGALPLLPIAEPDDELLASVLLKLLDDRQLNASPAAVTYLVSHMERSMAFAQTLVGAIDALSWEKQKPLTRPIAREALARIAALPA